MTNSWEFLSFLFPCVTLRILEIPCRRMQNTRKQQKPTYTLQYRKEAGYARASKYYSDMHIPRNQNLRLNCLGLDPAVSSRAAVGPETEYSLWTKR
jgi:hypothetical protein